MNTLYKFTILMILTVSITACNKTDDEQPIQEGPGEGILIFNEGPFMSGTGSVTFHGETSVDNLFETVNGRPLGNIVQSYSQNDTYGFVVVNNADKVEVVNPVTFQSIATISDLSSPRYVEKIADKLWAISEWTTETNGRVTVVEAPDFNVIKTIAVGSGPEHLRVFENHLLVLNSGGYGSSNTVSIISLNTMEVTNTVEVCDNPNSIALHGTHVYIMCGGQKIYNADFTLNEAESTNGSIAELDLTGSQIVWTSDQIQFRPNNLTLTGQQLLFLNGNSIYKFDPVTMTSALLRDGYYYSLSAGSNNILYASDPADFASKGTVYALDASNGNVISEYEAGIIPTQVVEKEK